MKKTSLFIFLSLAVGVGAGLIAFSSIKHASLEAVDENAYWNHYERIEPTTSMHGSKEFWAHCSLHSFTLSKPSDGDEIKEGVAFNSTKYFAELTSEDPRYIAPLEAEIKKKSFPLQNAGYIAKNTNLNGYSNTFEDFTFTFSNGGGQNPESEKSNYIVLYESNTLTISSKYEIRKLEFNRYEGKVKDGALSSDVGSVVKDGVITRWTGASKSVTLTAAAQYRFDNVDIYYVEHTEPVISGEHTIKEIKDFAKDYEYTPSSHGWYLTTNLVTIKIKAIDAIDSVTTSGLDGGARGKVLCVDETGYIICSSGVSTNNPIDFYQRVKDYIKAGTTTYVVSGYLAFFNDVVELKVNTYEYDKTLTINYDLNDYVNSAVTSASILMNHCKNIKQNQNGYGVGDIVKLNGLTYFNKYNSAGSYYFLDRNSELVPIYSLLDKDRSALIEGKVYDIIGFESLYNGRPSLRILEVIPNTSEDPTSFDFSNAVEMTSTDEFYKINPYQSGYEEQYYSSVTTIYKMDAYVSRYADDKYTFNTSYYYDLTNKEYTTGSSQVNAANRKSLGMFNEDLTFKQVFADFVLENAESEEECEELKVTIYFTLAYLDKVDGKYMWRVNVFEDLVFSLEYYESSSQSISLNSKASSWTHDEDKQVFASNGITVTNASTSINNYAYDPSYLKIVDGTSLTIEFSEPIMAFTINHATYSYIAGLGDLDIKAYRQFKDYTVVLLKTKATKVEINDFAVGGNRNNAYLRVDSITVNY